MDDLFHNRVIAAAIAGWWTLLIAVGFITLQWLVYLEVMSAQPSWLLSMWGPGTDWHFVQIVWFSAIAALKFVFWLMTLVVIWLSLWARQLRKQLTDVSKGISNPTATSIEEISKTRFR